MRSFRGLQRQLLALAPNARLEFVPTVEAAGRVLLRGVVARMNDPAEWRSAMDGYAVAHGELAGASPARPVSLRESGVSPAGRYTRQPLAPGEVRRIMTGAAIPPGADAVVPVERVSTDGRRVRFTGPAQPLANLRRPGENFKRGDPLIRSHTVLRPQEIGLCITAGVPRLGVAKRLRVGVLSTGTELVPPSTRLRHGEVFDSNRPMVLASVAATGALPVDLGSIGDRVSLLASRVRQARRTTDVLITIGGVSAGDFDIVKIFLRSCPTVRQVRVAMRPARPQAFGRWGRLFWYALPGNPVSALVAFEQLVRPFLLRAMGHQRVFRPVRRGRCDAEVKSSLRIREFVRARAVEEKGEWRLRKVGPEGSGNLRSMVEANAFMVVPEDCARVSPGDLVNFELLSDPPSREKPD